MKPILPLFLFLLVLVAVGVLAQGITHKRPPQVTLDAPTKRKLVEKAVTLKAGDSFQTVTNALGKPTTDTNYGDDWHILEYHIQIWEGAYGEDAEFLKIRLDKSNRVISIWVRAELK